MASARVAITELKMMTDRGSPPIQDYQQWLKDGGGVAGSAFYPESEEEFLEASRQAWTHLLMQIIKVSSIVT